MSRKILLAIVFWGVCYVDASATEPVEVQQARDLIKDNGRSIVYFALPTYKYVSTGYNDYRRLSDGYELTFTFECTSFWRTNTASIAFYFDADGLFDFCKPIRSTTHYTPFTTAVGKKQAAKLHAFLADHPVVHDSRKLLREAEAADARKMCELYLKAEQTRRNLLPKQSSTKKEPLDAVFVQTSPRPERPNVWTRSKRQKRAVVLVHGFRFEFERFLTARAVVQGWQQSDSFMVTILGRDADVYAFAYGQNVPVQEIAEAAELANGIGRLKKLGYSDVVLVGYSAGGLICRQFVEDHPTAGVTKVVQVCAPNSGVFWARFSALACGTQRPFVCSLTACGRRECCKDRAKVIPSDVEFVCVVGEAAVKTDWVVSSRSQWSDDLQQQGVPAIRLHVAHPNVVEKPECIEAIARVIREPAPRWDTTHVQLARHEILGN